MAKGQISWKSRGASDSEFIVEAIIEKNMSYEFRHTSAIGNLSKEVTTRVYKNDRNRTEDVASGGVIASKEISNGDEVRFSLTQNLVGSPTYGDSPVKTGDYLAYLHKSVKLNKIDTPAFPIQEEMSVQRVKEMLGTQESEIRKQISLYLSEEYIYDVYRSFFRGASQALLAPEDVGGLGLDIGAGAGNQISCEHVIVASRGLVSGQVAESTIELANYEQRICNELTAADADIAGLTDYEAQKKYGLGRGVCQDIREFITDSKIKPVMTATGMKWYCPTDPALLRQLTQEGGELYESWKIAMARDKNNPVYGYGHIELDGLVFFPDQYLKQFRPTGYTTAAKAAWGSSDFDMRNKFNTSKWAPLLILGETAILEAHNGSVNTTIEEGKHGKGKEIAGHVKQSFVRSRWTAKDGRNSPSLNQNSALALFWTPNTLFSPKAP